MQSVARTQGLGSLREVVAVAEPFRKKIGRGVGDVVPMRANRHGTSARLLEHVPLFAGLPPRDLRRIASLADEVWFNAGRVVAEAGTPGSSFYVILDGEARVVRPGTDDTVRRLGPGDHFGELALLDGGTRTVTVIVDSTLDVMRIQRAAFRRMLLEEPEVAVRLLSNLASRIREIERALQ
jgi:CRP/FNR family transcriptional regulator, cyclic AMP receptor protein